MRLLQEGMMPDNAIAHSSTGTAIFWIALLVLIFIVIPMLMGFYIRWRNKGKKK